IRAVSMETVEEICKPYRPTQRTSAPMRNGKRMAIDPTTDHVYQQRINEFNRLSSWVYTLVAIDLDIEDDAGNVVWSADNTIHDVDAARRVLTGMGLVDQQMV